MQRELITYPDPDLMARATAARTLLALGDTLCGPDRERVDWAVTGGTDGTAILRAIAASDLIDTVDWHRVHVWWSDERFVAPGSDERNDRAADAALFGMLVDTVRMERAQIHAMPADTRSADEVARATAEENERVLRTAAERYQMELLHDLGDDAAMDLMMFGLGPDGHIASLFPGRDEVLLDDPELLVTGVDDSPKPPARRLTMTVPMIRRAARVWICGSRAAKAEAMARTFAATDDPQAPASWADATRQLLWIGDEASTKAARG
ncbi:MAG: 6-phosphogluconolactonase [Bifidobacterium sp.]|nr:6-phosphogluconolactonase [Bifidobacterium sp.]